MLGDESVDTMIKQSLCQHALSQLVIQSIKHRNKIWIEMKMSGLSVLLARIGAQVAAVPCRDDNSVVEHRSRKLDE